MTSGSIVPKIAYQNDLGRLESSLEFRGRGDVDLGRFASRLLPSTRIYEEESFSLLYE